MTYSWWEVWGGPLAPSQTLIHRQRKKEDAFYSLQIFFFFFFFLKPPDQPNNLINNNKTEMCHTVGNVNSLSNMGALAGVGMWAEEAGEEIPYYGIFKLCNSMHIY